MTVTPINTMNNPGNFSPQQSDANSEVNRRPSRVSSQPSEPVNEPTQTKTTEVADTVLTVLGEEATEKAAASYFDQAKEFFTTIERDYKLFNRPIVAMKQPFWFVKSLQHAYQTYMGTAPVDPFLEKRKALQEAIEKVEKPEEFWEVLAQKVENGRLLNEPLPNGHLPLNYTIFKGNQEAMKILLKLNCNPEQRDFQSQTALDVAHVTGNEEIQQTLKECLISQQKKQLLNNLKKEMQEKHQVKVAQTLKNIEEQVEKFLANGNPEEMRKQLKEFVIAQEKAQFLESLKGKKPEEIDQKKIDETLKNIEMQIEKKVAERTNEEIQQVLKKILVSQHQMQFLEELKGKKTEEIDEEKVAHEVEKHVEKFLAERMIVDPLALSKTDKIAAVTAMILIASQLLSNTSMVQNYYSQEYLLPAVRGFNMMTTVSQVFEGIGSDMPMTVRMSVLVCSMLPQLHFIYKPFQTGTMALSMLNSLKVTADNYRLRGWDSLTKLAVNSMNFYHFLTYTPPTENKTSPTQEKREWVQIDLTDKERDTVCKAMNKASLPLHPDKSMNEPENVRKVFQELIAALNGARDVYCYGKS